MWKWSLGVKQRVALEGFRPLMHADNTERTFEQIGGRPKHQAVPEVKENKASDTLAATDEAQARQQKHQHLQARVWLLLLEVESQFRNGHSVGMGQAFGRADDQT